MTSDSKTIANLLPNLSPDLMPYPGADAAAGIKLAIEMMTNTGLASGDIILITDDIDDLEQREISKQLAGTPWRLVILGVGTRSGAPIKLADGSLMTGSSGQPVVAKANFDNMRALASQLDGYFVPVQVTNSDVESIVLATSRVDGTSTSLANQTISEQINQGYWLLPLLVIPALLVFRRGVFFAATLILLPALSPKPALASPWLNDNQRAMEMYNKQEYAEAAELFEDSQWKGIAQYQAGDFSAAINSLQGAQELEQRYNLANAYAQNGQLDQAAKMYEQILTEQPDHKDAKQNLDIVRKAQQQQPMNACCFALSNLCGTPFGCL
ncbi:tetratricopeptide repeat protein, partial [Vibrio sp. Hep-1b-8]|uniref:tetratricopeptide repeat protein n=1 Tax=Vibrio sp. Hep-1b-8 TaxID=2144187 RepID=UPI0011107C94